VTKESQASKSPLKVDASFSENSPSSVNNDRKNSVVLYGNLKVAVEDVWGIRKTISLKYKGDKVNMFNVLSITECRNMVSRVGEEGDSSKPGGRHEVGERDCGVC
jgi:hypothetical protein